MGETERKVGAVCCREDVDEITELTFDEILLNETLVEGSVRVSREALAKAGGINYRLSGKRRYELLLRIAQHYRVMVVPFGEKTVFGNGKFEAENAWICVDGEDISENSSDMRTDCYLIGRYKQRLLDLGCFDDAVLGVVSAGGEAVVPYLEEMLAGNKGFYDIYDATQPILIYKGTDLCYSVLDTFAKCLGDALEACGQCVEYFDMEEQEIEEIVYYTKRRFKAIIGLQTYMFSVQNKDGSLVHDNIDAPMYHFVFDHPIWLKNHLTKVPRRLCVLTPDGNYARFVEKYYGHRARFFPPAGREMCGEQAREYGISFLGSYGEGLVEHLRVLRSADKRKCHLVNRYILYMRKHLRSTPEEALCEVLREYDISCTKEEFVDKMHEIRWVALGLANHYRNKVVYTLLQAGITLHLFGDSWKKSPMWGHPKLAWHEAAIGDEAFVVYAKSKLSLNVMTWHKDGFTERIANAMLHKSVVITDKTTYLEQNFSDGEDIVMFDLGHLEKLPQRIKGLLLDEERRAQIAERAYKKAQSEHTWEKRAEQLLQLIEEDRDE